ncbi:MAG: STAS domain-containing protein [Planctomycetes bacterium]|jgi:anti-sigma B factor antagonist|nr:STAS domain-containing protein [Planctomycetota bacterium]
MNITTESYGHAVILILKGDLLEDAIEPLRQAVDHQLANKEVIDIVLNLENVPFIDSKAMEYLLDLQDKLAERLGQVRFVKCDENIRKILEITRLDSVFEVFDDVTEAVKAVEV